MHEIIYKLLQLLAKWWNDTLCPVRQKILEPGMQISSVVGSESILFLFLIGLLFN